MVGRGGWVVFLLYIIVCIVDFFYRAWGYHLYHLSGFKAVLCLLLSFFIIC